jgi:hypothetical protein
MTDKDTRADFDVPHAWWRALAPPTKRARQKARACRRYLQPLFLVLAGCHHGSTEANAPAAMDANQEEITKSLHALLPHADRLDSRQMRLLRAAAAKCELGVIGAHSALSPEFDRACLKDAAPNQMEVIFRKAQ